MRYVCSVCGYIYDPEQGDPESNIKPGTLFMDLPDDWVCPICGVSKDQFEKMDQMRMKPRMLAPHVWWVGAVDWDRRLFDELIPLPDGTSYNAYLIQGSQKTALIDTVDPTMTRTILNNLVQLQIQDLDYIIVNHVEQDHSGTLPEILQLYPNATVLATPSAKTLLMNLLLIPGNKIQTVEDREIISMGNKTLEFIHTPWVHWPDTMWYLLKRGKDSLFM